MPGKASPGSVVLFYRLDKAYSAVPEDATAFSGSREPGWAGFIVAVCPTPELLEHDRGWTRSFWDALGAGVDRGIGSYVNAISDAGVDDRVRRRRTGSKYERLAAIKATYDPENLFHRNANIKPA